MFYWSLMAMPKVRADRADHLLKFLYIIFGSRHYYSCIRYWPDWCRADWCRPHWCRLIDAGPIDARALLMPIPIDAQLDRLMPDPIDAGPIHVLDKIQFYCEALLRPGPIDARPSWCQLSTTYACPDWCRSLLMPGPIDAGLYLCWSKPQSRIVLGSIAQLG